MFDHATNLLTAVAAGQGHGDSQKRVSGLKPPLFQKNWGFFFDIDGTLADIAATPGEALIPQETLDDLAALQQRTSVALISGRGLSSIDSLTQPIQFPAAGQHGLEIRFANDDIHYATTHQAVMNGIVEKVKIFQRRHTGLIVEYKGLSIAVHYRLMPALGSKVKAFLQSLLDGRENIMCLQHGKMVDEIKLRGGNKGTAIETFMKSPLFADKIPVFIGDDLTDEDGYKAVNKKNGISIQVGSASPHARFQLENPQAVRLWLHHMLKKWTPA